MINMIGFFFEYQFVIINDLSFGWHTPKVIMVQYSEKRYIILPIFIV